MSAAFGERITHAELIGNVGHDVIARATLAGCFLSGSTQNYARVPFGVSLGLQVHLF